MRVLVACEMSGVVRDAFCARGHDAVSCDLLRKLPAWYNIPPSNPDRAKIRSATFPGMAVAMAEQRGS